MSSSSSSSTDRHSRRTAPCCSSTTGDATHPQSFSDAGVAASPPTMAHVAAPAEAGVGFTSCSAKAAPGGLDSIRDTTEYKAAWDLELWKAVQAERFRKQLEKERVRAMSDLAQSLKLKEKEAAAALEKRAEAVKSRESRLERDAAALTQQKQRLEEAERAVRRMRQQLLDAQRRVEEDVRAQVRRANDDLTHKAAMLQARVKAAEAQAQRAEERQRQSQLEYSELYDAFHRFRTQQLLAANQPAPPNGEGGGEPAVVERLRLQHMEEVRLLREGMTQRHAAELGEANRRCHALEESNQRLTAALARRRAQLHTLRGDRSSTSRPMETAAAVASSQPRCGGAVQSIPILQELERLRLERQALVEGSAGAIGEEDEVVRRLDARIVSLMEEVAKEAGGRAGLSEVVLA